MFTGIIEEIGKVTKIKPIKGRLVLTVSADKVTRDLKIGDSVSVNGVCLTVTDFSTNHFQADAAGETLNKTSVKSFKSGEPVNLERSLLLRDRVGGHLVMGHINGTGKISAVKKMGENYLFSVTVPGEVENYLVKEGSVAIDGISLTIAQLVKNTIAISVIPYTWRTTNLQFRKTGDPVNLEVDSTAKYIEKFMDRGGNRRSVIIEELLNKLDY
jgi:riboflavin synthase